MGIFKKDCIMQKVITTFVFILFWFAAGELFAAGSASDSLAGKKPEKDDAPQLVEEFIRDEAKIVKGLTTLYFQDGKYYININDTLFGRDIRMVSRISRAAEGARFNFSGYAGDIVNSAMFRFERGPEDKIFLKSLSLRERSDTIMPENVQNSNFPTIVEVFRIKAQSADKTDNLIEVNDFLLSDSEYLFFPKKYKTSLGIGALHYLLVFPKVRIVAKTVYLAAKVNGGTGRHDTLLANITNIIHQ